MNIEKYQACASYADLEAACAAYLAVLNDKGPFHPDTIDAISAAAAVVAACETELAA